MATPAGAAFSLGRCRVVPPLYVGIVRVKTLSLDGRRRCYRRRLEDPFLLVVFGCVELQKRDMFVDAWRVMFFSFS
uniref:Uncharacterized protein n=1 Tax=Leersia perrieri TaxID=77586 RepID=A0A0D9WLT3_9ORYZ